MSIDIASVATALGPAAQAGAPGLQAGYGVSLTDFGGFQQALHGVQMRLEARPVGATSETAKQLMKPFDHINGEAQKLSLDANAARNEGREMTPGEVVMLSVRCSEFMFHCQLTANIANRTSDGLSQLFRQQS
jgi:hypothetical protein